MAKKKKSLKLIKNIFIRLFLVGIVVGGFYAYKNPQVLGISTEEKVDQENLLSSQESLSSKISSYINKDKISQILGDTTSLVSEGLETIKVPKKITGLEEEIVIQDVVDDFTQKVRDLPQEQVNQMKVQFCKDILSEVESVSIQEQ